MPQPSVVVRPNPVLFELPESSSSSKPSSTETIASKENESPKSNNNNNNSLPYRSIFAVMTLDSVLIYDTHHEHPLSIVKGLHYTGLTDCCWSQDGHTLIVSSTDGYLSIVSFSQNELGKTLQPVTRPPVSKMVPSPVANPLPPCRAGPTVLESRPNKKARITPTLMPSQTQPSVAKRSAPEEEEEVGDAVHKLSLDNHRLQASGEQPKKKKRIQPMLIST